MERYDEPVTALYDGSDEIEMEITITYQDGRESDERGLVRIVDVDEPVIDTDEAEASDEEGATAEIGPETEAEVEPETETEVR